MGTKQIPDRLLNYIPDQGFRIGELLNTRWRQHGAALVLTVLASPLVNAGVAAAQGDPSGTASGVICDTGVGDVLALGFALVALYFILKGIAQVFAAADKMGSGRDNERREGRQAMSGAGKTLAFGIFGIPIIAFLLDYVGVNSLSCINWSAISPIGGGGTTATLVPHVTDAVATIIAFAI